MQTANELLMGGGGKSASFPTVGASVTGRLTAEPKAQQQTDLTTGQPKFFANGDPMMQVVVQLQTSDRDPLDPEDDGIRSLYIKSNMLKAVKEAIRAANAKGLEVGGTLTVTYTADGERSNKAFNPPKLYGAVYKAPTGEAANSLLMGAPATPVAAAPVGNVPPGIDPAVWAALDATQRQAVAAASSVTSSAPPF